MRIALIVGCGFIVERRAAGNVAVRVLVKIVNVVRVAAIVALWFGNL